MARIYVKCEVSEDLRRQVKEAAAAEDRTPANWLLRVVKKELENRKKRKGAK